MDILIQDIRNRLSAEIPALKYIDEDWGQLDDYSPHFPVKWPCALIDITQVNYSNVGKTGQLGEAAIAITVADVKLLNSSSKAPSNQKAEQSAYLKLIQAVHIALHGWSGHSHYTKLIRTTFKRIKRDDGVRQHQLTYTCRMEDISTVPKKITAAARPNIIAQPTRPLLNPDEIGATIGEMSIEWDFKLLDE